MSDEKDRQVRPFAAFLQEQREGVTHSELSEGLSDLVAACIEHGKGGTLTYKVSIKPNKDGVTVFVTDAITVKAPVGERSAALFFADDDGNLSRKDPRQQELPLREVSRPVLRGGEPKEAQA